MYGHDDLYSTYARGRYHKASRRGLLPVEEVIDQIAEEAADQTTVEIYGAFNLSAIGDWAKGLVNPQQRLQNWQNTLDRLVQRWNSANDSGDTKSDQIGHRMLNLVEKIKGRQPAWQPPAPVQTILAQYERGEALGMSAAPSKRPKVSKKGRGVKGPRPKSPTSATAMHRTPPGTTAAPKSETDDLQAHIVALTSNYKNAEDPEEAQEEIADAIEVMLEENPNWSPPTSVVSMIESFGSVHEPFNASHNADLYDALFGEDG